MFKYEVLSEDQLKGSGKLKEGTATFKIISADDKDKNGYVLTSKAGNEMMKVSYSVTDAFGSNGLLVDYFLANQSWKVAKLLDSVGKSDWYKQGSLIPANLRGLMGQCVLKKDSTPEYPDQVKIASYVDMSQVESTANPQGNAGDDFDDIPF
jgi:hypothetical protein